MGTLDLAIIAVYFAITLGVGLRVARNQRTAGDYFLGARDLPAFAILLSIVATETSAITVISIPGVAARGDLTFLQLAFGYLIGRIGVAAWLLPGYFDGAQETAYARLERRFGANARRLTSMVFLVTRFLGDSVRVYASAIPLSLVTGWSIPTAIVAMGIVTLIYTWFGGFKAVVWTDVFQLVIYLAGGVGALFVAWSLAGGAGHTFALAAQAGKLRLINPAIDFTTTYTLLGGLVGGAMLSAASHGTDHLIVQRLLATRSLGDARRALIGSGVMVIFQFTLFLMVGLAIWAAGLAPEGMNNNQIFSRFVVEHLPTGLAGIVVAGILAAAMGTHSSAINSLASSATHDLYAPWTGRTDPAHLLRIGRLLSATWGTALIFGAIFFHAYTTSMDTPVVELALSIASVTYGALLGSYILAVKSKRVGGPQLIAAIGATLAVMLVVLFARRIVAAGGPAWLAPVGALAWPWYVPLGTALTVGIAVGLGLLGGRTRTA